VAAGTATGTNMRWSDNCPCYACVNSHFRLLCFQLGAGPSLPLPVTTGKKAFVTSIWGSGDLSSWADAGGLSGLAAGDAVCAARAAAANLGGSFKAWLSSSAGTASGRLTSQGPWVRLDGVKVADTKADLVLDGLFTTLNLAETGEYLTWLEGWTGTDEDGSARSETCNDWTDGMAASTGAVGSATDTHWWPFVNNWIPSCNGSNRLFCLED
jgi:hypothetical protein